MAARGGHNGIASAESLPSPRPRPKLQTKAHKRMPGLKSISKLSDIDFKQSFDASVDPESLFAQYTISEVKAIQNRLRVDAEAKQEELRQMVGERYRDLLQASTSIVDMADSSQRILNAIVETMDSIKSQAPSHAPQHQQSSLKDGNDPHLHALQLLAAHIKLLLDAPEHMWRLIESKKFLSASWLFQLANLIHQTLLRGDEDETWTGYGISVEDQFPLIERQWDVVKQFRPQIVQKATLALRDFEASAVDTCATLLTLHLLDRRPLSEAFNSVLTQRAKSLQEKLSAGPCQPNEPNASTPSTPSPQIVSVQDIRDATLSTFSAISSTMSTLRVVFQETTDPPLISRVLEFLQSEQSASSNIPNELRISTESLLMTLPSSTQLMILPPSLKDFRPNVNTSSVSSSVSQSQVSSRMEAWFRKSCGSLQRAMDEWFADLHTLREVWTIRSSLRKWLGSSPPLEPSEYTEMESIYETCCRKRIIAIWKVTLLDAETAFREQLESAIQSLRNDRETGFAGSSPLEFMFFSTALPVASSSSSALVLDSAFSKYQTNLKKQLLGRNAIHDRLITTLEVCAGSIKHDLEFILSHVSQEDGRLTDQFMEEFRVDTLEICQNVLTTLRDAAQRVRDSELKCLAFLCRIVNDLSSQSSFLSDLGEGGNSTLDFRKQMVSMQDEISTRWRNCCVEQTLDEYRKGERQGGLLLHHPTILESIIHLNRAIEHLGITRDSALLSQFADKLVTHFISEVLKISQRPLNELDIGFLRKLASVVCYEATALQEHLDKQASGMDPSSCSQESEQVSELFSRTQLLFSMLLPYPVTDRVEEEPQDKFSTLLPYGVPVVEQNYKPLLETVKSSRFGLLLVDSSALH